MSEGVRDGGQRATGRGGVGEVGGGVRGRATEGAELEKWAAAGEGHTLVVVSFL